MRLFQHYLATVVGASVRASEGLRRYTLTKSRAEVVDSLRDLEQFGLVRIVVEHDSRIVFDVVEGSESELSGIIVRRTGVGEYSVVFRSLDVDYSLKMKREL